MTSQDLTSKKKSESTNLNFHDILENKKKVGVSIQRTIIDRLHAFSGFILLIMHISEPNQPSLAEDNT